MPRLHTPGVRGAVLAFGIFMGGSRAAVITGVVRDSTTEEPISGVTVQVKGTATGTATDGSGRFSLTVANSITDQPVENLKKRGLTINQEQGLIYWDGGTASLAGLYTVQGEPVRVWRQVSSLALPRLNDGLYLWELVMDGIRQIGTMVKAGSFISLSETGGQGNPAAPSRARAAAAPVVLEAESMTLAGYIVETARPHLIMLDPNGPGTGTATTTFTGATGDYNVVLTAIPENDGTPTVRVSIGGTRILERVYPEDPSYYDCSIPIEYTAYSVPITSGAQVVIEGAADSEAYARVDKITCLDVNAVTLSFTKQGYQGREVEVDAGTDVDIVVRLIPYVGFPDETNTGVQDCNSLTPASGRTITVANAIIEDERITSGGLTIAAANVTVRHCCIANNGGGAGGSGVVSIRPGASATIEYCSLNGNNDTHAAIWHEGAWMVARGNNIFNVNDGIFCWDADNFTIEDNYLHGFTTAAGNGHIDGFQTEGASHGIIRHNTFKVTQSQNACVAIWNGRRDSDDILVENNFMAGSGFAVYAEDYHPSEASPAGGYSVTNIRFINNVFSTKYFSCVGYWGIWYPRGNPTDAWNRSGNYVLETGLNVDGGNPPGCN